MRRMEPLNCTVSVTPDGVEMWAPTQAPGTKPHSAGRSRGLQPETVMVHATLLGGGFGRKFAQDFAIDAALISKQPQAPVQLVYTREDDMRAQHYRPAMRVELSAGVDAAGQPVSFKAHCRQLLGHRHPAGFAKPDALDEAAARVS